MSAAARQNLVCARLGQNSALETWFRPHRPRSWDLLLSYYTSPVGPLRNYAEFFSFGGLSKFAAIKGMHTTNPALFQRYSSIWIIDDDIKIDFECVDQLFACMGRFGLALAQPSLSSESHLFWEITRNEPDSMLRYTNFVEVMMPAFSQSAFQRCVDTFDKSISSWGLDFVWPKVLGYPPNGIGIFDCITAAHTKKVDIKEGAFYKYLENLGIDPAAELNQVINAYGLSGDISPKVTTTIPKSAAPQPLADAGINRRDDVAPPVTQAPSARARAAAEKGDLVRLAIEHQVDKWGEHWYAAHYDHHFASFRNRPIKLLEIGVGGYEHPLQGGQSLRMWAEYFPNAVVYGIDIHDKSAHASDRIRIRRGSQDDPEFLRSVAGEVETGFDIIIDDGSHINKHIIKSFATLFPLLNDGGLYAIEDLQTSYWPGFGGSSEDLNAPSSALGFLKNLIDCLNYEEVIRPGYQPTYLDKHIVELHFYHNLLIIKKGSNDEGSNRLKNNVPTTAEPETVQLPDDAPDDFDPTALLRLKP